MKVLVTGGAGYIGSVTVRRLLEHGHDVEIFDDFSTGHRSAVPAGLPLHDSSLLDPESLAIVLARRFDAVVHFAAFSLVGESVANPLKYWGNNVAGSVNLVGAALEAGVPRFVFSSSAAVYGEPDVETIDEDARLAPVNPYGRTKLAIEWALADAARQTGMCATALRYFNACGADGALGEDHAPETHLIPRLLLSRIDPNFEFQIFGDDYPTPDGTCIRDYIHVRDLAEAHVKAIEAVDRPGLTPINLGTATGRSVREIIDVASRVVGEDFAPVVRGRRSGDPARLVASNAKAEAVLGWRPVASDLETILGDAWRWHQEHPRGYDDR